MTLPEWQVEGSKGSGGASCLALAFCSTWTHNEQEISSFFLFSFCPGVKIATLMSKESERTSPATVFNFSLI